MIPERLNLQNQEINRFRPEFRFSMPGSVYAGEKIGNQIFVGGSTWDRKNTAFNTTTRNSQGLLTQISRTENNNFIQRNSRTLPSMVNSIVPIQSNIFVGCKRVECAYNLFDRNLNHLASINDHEAAGVYNAIKNPNTNEILAVTRNGWLKKLDRNLREMNKIHLSGDNRLWSITMDERNGIIYSGDYKGNLYAIDDYDFTLIAEKNLGESISRRLPINKKKYDPSLYGLTVGPDSQITASIRWGQINKLRLNNGRFQIEDSVIIPEEISALSSDGKSNDLLIGTRSGKLLSMHHGNIESILHIPPALQNDNSPWSISQNKNETLACFSDGQVVGLRK